MNIDNYIYLTVVSKTIFETSFVDRKDRGITVNVFQTHVFLLWSRVSYPLKNPIIKAITFI